MSIGGVGGASFSYRPDLPSAAATVARTEPSATDQGMGLRKQELQSDHARQLQASSNFDRRRGQIFDLTV